MFEYDISYNKTCRFYPHANLKDKLWTDYAEGGNVNQTLYVLSCATPTHQPLPRNKFLTLSQTCTAPVLEKVNDGANMPNVVYGGQNELIS